MEWYSVSNMSSMRRSIFVQNEPLDILVIGRGFGSDNRFAAARGRASGTHLGENAAALYNLECGGGGLASVQGASTRKGRAVGSRGVSAVRETAGDARKRRDSLARAGDARGARRRPGLARRGGQLSPRDGSRIVAWASGWLRL